jgi:hypothetical protein
MSGDSPIASKTATAKIPRQEIFPSDVDTIVERFEQCAWPAAPAYDSGSLPKTVKSADIGARIKTMWR